MIGRDSVWKMRFYWIYMIIMEFTKEVIIDCHEQAKVKHPESQEEIEYNDILNSKIIEENGN